MDIHSSWMVFCLAMALSVVEAKSVSKLPDKLVVDLNKRPQSTTTKPPQERRKLAIFPKYSIKFVVTTKPYSKVRTFSPWEISTKRPLVQFYTEEPQEKHFLESFEKEHFENFYREKPDYNSNDIKDKERKGSVKKELEAKVDSDEISTLSDPKNKVNKSNVANFVSLNTEDELEASIKSGNDRREDLSVERFSESQNVEILPTQESYSSEELRDLNEFIFIKNIATSKAVKEEAIEKDLRDSFENSEEFATETVMLEEYPTKKPRQERSVNVIEEENFATTVSGFKYTDQDKGLHSDLVFRNIHS